MVNLYQYKNSGVGAKALSDGLSNDSSKGCIDSAQVYQPNFAVYITLGNMSLFVGDYLIMRVKFFVVLSAMVASFSGCVVIHTDPTRPVKMEKGSAVDLRTQLDATELVWNSMQRLGCRQTDVIYPEIVEKSPDFQAGTGFVIKGQVKERWVAHGCNLKIPYIVDLKANKQNEGGSDIYIRRESGGS